MIEVHKKRLFIDVKIELTDEQTQKLIKAADVTATLTSLVGLVPPPLGPVATTVASAWIQLNKIRVARANKGNGVIITIHFIHPLLRLAGPFVGPVALILGIPGIEVLFASVRSR